MAWDGEGCYALFDRASGLTHLINEFPAAILTSLTDGRADLAQLADELANLCGAVSDERWRQTTAISVDGLVALGLIDLDLGC